MPHSRCAAPHSVGNLLAELWPIIITAVGYYNGAWTTDQRRALALRRREAAEAHAARMRDRCPRNAELINVEEVAAAD